MELKGKPLSLGTKILAAAIAVGSLVLKITVAPNLDIDAALKVAAFITLVFGSVDLSLIVSNISGSRHPRENTNTGARKATADKEALYGR